MFGIPNPNLTDKTGIRIAEAIESLGGATPGASTNLYGSGIPDPNITDETGIRIAEALENFEPGGGSGLPEVTPADAGKILGVNQDGEWDKMDAPSSERMTVHFEQEGEGPIVCNKTYSEIKDYLDENPDGAIDVTLYQPNGYIHNAKCVSIDNHYINAEGVEVEDYCFNFLNFSQSAPNSTGRIYLQTIFYDNELSPAGWNILSWMAPDGWSSSSPM